MNIYDLNKQLISQCPCLDKEQMCDAKDTINDYGKNTNNKYYMLLCKDISYYTLFNIDFETSALEDFGSVVLDCATDIGAIKAVDQVEEAIEIWVHPEGGEPLVMYLFAYDMGVVRCTL
jgi:hypothetical protein